MAFLSIFKPSANQWQTIDQAVYAQAYQQYGGSMLTHPQVITAMCNSVGVEAEYRAEYNNDTVSGAVAVWNKRYLVGDKTYLKKIGKRQHFDSGNAEVILPLDSNRKFSLSWLRGQFISELHADNIDGLKVQAETLSMARSLSNGGFSSKFRYNRRRELKLFEQDGGTIVSFDQLDAQTIAEHYITLFFKRWGKKPKGYERLHTFLHAIRPLVHGHLLVMNNKPIAIQLIYIAANNRIVSAEYINGGVDPQFRQYSPGSILSFINLQMAEEIAAQHHVPLRYSYGITDKEYKNTWCDTHPVYRL